MEHDKMTIVQQAQIGNEIMRIMVEDQPIDPREWDNLGKMVCWHRRYNLGDKHDYTIAQFRERMAKEKMVVLQLYLYDHSGISMSTSNQWPFNSHWDAGQVGYIYATYETIRKEYNVKRITRKLQDKVCEVLRSEVETYDLFIRGQVFGFQVVKLVTCKTCGHTEEKHVDSCWGFYGTEWEKNGIFDHVDKKWRKAEWKEETE